MFWPEFSESNSLSELRRIQNEVNRLFGEYEGAGESFPAVNIWTNKDGAVLKAEIPGVDPADIAVSVHDEQVDISGERKQITKAIEYLIEKNVGVEVIKDARADR